MSRLAVAIIVVLALSAAARAADPCRFVVLGDSRPRWGGADKITPSVAYLRAIAEIDLLRPEFVVNVGDLIYGYGPTAKLEQQWDAFDAATKQLRAPVYLVVGNHAVFNEESEALYQRRHGKLWYSAEAGACHLVVLFWQGDANDWRDASRWGRLRPAR